MNVSEQIHTVLHGAVPAQCVRPNKLSEGDTLPAIVYTVVNTSPTQSLQGDCHLDNVTVQIDIWSQDYAELQSLASAVRKRMEQKVPLVANPMTPEDYFHAQFSDEHTGYADEAERYRIILEFSVWRSQF